MIPIRMLLVLVYLLYKVINLLKGKADPNHFAITALDLELL